MTYRPRRPVLPAGVPPSPLSSAPAVASEKADAVTRTFLDRARASRLR